MMTMRWFSSSRLAVLAVTACAAFFAGTRRMDAQQAQPSYLPVIVADFNQDGIPDALVMSATTPTATIALGSIPYGSFTAAAKAVTFPAGCTALPQGSLLTGDLNGDGFPDIVFLCGGAVGVMLGNGDGSFAAARILDAFGTAAVLGDFNHDGKLDLALFGQSGANVVVQTIEFYAGNGDGTFAHPVLSPFPQAAAYSMPIAADVNGDGYPDIVAGSFSGATKTIGVFGNNQNGTFGTLTQGVSTPNVSATIPAAAPTSILTGNFFGAVATDFIVPDTGANPGYFLIQNTSPSDSYSLGTPLKTAYPALTGAMAGSFTGSGATDLLVSNGTALTVLANDGTGNLTASYGTLALSFAGSAFAVADANGDGYSDVYTATLPAAGALQLAVNLTTGSATATSQPFSLGIGMKAVSAVWPGNVNFAGSTASGTQVVVGATAVATVASSKNPSQLGDAVTFTVLVAPAATTASIPSGSIVLSDGTSMLASGMLDGTGAFSYTTSALAQGTHSITAAYAGDSIFAATVSPAIAQVVNHVAIVTPNLTWATPAPIAYGTALGASQLNALATDGSGAAVPGTYTYTPAAGTILAPGTQTLNVNFVPADAADFSNATASVRLVVTGLSVTSFTPATVNLGSPATTITVLGSGFVANSVVLVNGVAVPTTLVTPTTLTAVVPAAYFATVGTLQITVSDPGIGMVSVGSPLGVVAGPPAATVSAPPTAPPASQPTVTFALQQPYPVDLTVTLDLGFASSTTPAVDDPSIQFSQGGRALTFVVPANSLTVPTIQLQAGTVAGTITIPITLTASGVNVTPTTLLPVVIVVPTAVPLISGMSLARSGNQLTVVMHGYSNTREMVTANFQFTAAPGADIGTKELTLPADTIFTAWYGTTPSDQYGSTFTYTQIFDVSDPAITIGSVQATLTNTVGASVSASAQ